MKGNLKEKLKKKQKSDNAAKKVHQNRTIGENIKLFFVKPSEIFIQINKGKCLRNLLIISGLITAIFVFLQYYFFSQSTVNEILKLELDPETAEALANTSISIGSALFITVCMVLVGYLTILVMSGIYYVLVAAMNRRLTYKLSVTIYSIAFIVTMLGQLLWSLLSNIFGIGSITDDPYLSVVLGQFNIFYLWSLVLIFIGIRTYTYMSKKRALMIIIIVFVSTTLFLLAKASISETFNLLNTIG